MYFTLIIRIFKSISLNSFDFQFSIIFVIHLLESTCNVETNILDMKIRRFPVMFNPKF